MSPDKNRVYYSGSGGGNYIELNNNLNTVNFSGDSSSRGLQVSPDGNNLAFITSNTGSGPISNPIVLTNKDGGAVTTLASPSFSPYSPFLAWSNDSTYLLFSASSNQKIFKINKDGTGLTDITPLGFFNNKAAGAFFAGLIFNPVGNQIAYFFSGNSNSNSSIYLSNPDFSGESIIFPQNFNSTNHIVYSQDGSEIWYGALIKVNLSNLAVQTLEFPHGSFGGPNLFDN